MNTNASLQALDERNQSRVEVAPDAIGSVVLMEKSEYDAALRRARAQGWAAGYAVGVVER